MDMHKLSPRQARLQLAANGYSTIPVNGKIPHIRGWQTWFHRDAEVIVQWDGGYPDHRNTSLLTRDNPFLDLDITDEIAVTAARELVLDRYELSPLRIGKAPKCGFLFQISGAPFAKITCELIAPDGKEHRIEFLSDGNQVVVHGIHPDTKSDYTWHGGDPSLIKHDDLTGITAQEAQRLVNDIVTLLIEKFGYRLKREAAQANGAGTGAQAPDWYDRVDDLANHDNVIALVMKLQRSGMNDTAVESYVQALIERYVPDDDPERKARRMGDVPRAVRDGRAKIAAKAAKAPEIITSLPIIRASDITMKAIEWLWPNRFALGKLGIIAGLPEEGKGQVVYDIVARVTRGNKWPLDEGQAPLGNVIILCAEDDLEDTVVPRLKSAGADCDRVYFVKMIKDKESERMFSFAKDLPALRLTLREIKDVMLLIVDPMSAYLGTDVDAYRDTEVRSVLAPLADLMQESKIAIITIMHFNKKTDVNNALLRIANTLAFGALARHVYACTSDPDNERKLFTRGKNNLAVQEASANKKALAYRFEARMVGHDPVSGKEIWAPHIIWDPEYVDVTVTEAMNAMNAATSAGKSPTARDSAKKFLSEMIGPEGASGKELQEHAKQEGIAERTLFRAKGEMGIVARRNGPDGEWFWHLPPPGWHGDDDEEGRD